MFLYLWLVPLLLWLFLVGAALGSFLNVCIYRIPRGKSLIWPGSHCGHCFHEVRLKDNIPLVSYWVLRGRCRDCGAAFSMRYFWGELLTALAFVALFLLEVGLNVLRLPLWPHGGLAALEWGPPPLWWALVVPHAALVCYLIAAAGCLLDSGRLPVSIAVSGTLAGLLAALLLPWPFPLGPAAALTPPPDSPALILYYPVDGPPGHSPRGPMPADASWANWPVSPRPGFYPWPVWGPLPSWLPPGTWQLGLATGLAGAAVGGWGLRLLGLAALLGRGRQVVPAGLPGLAAMAGAFLGWQPILVAAVLAFAIATPLSAWRPQLPALGPGLIAGILVSWLGWAWVGPLVRPALFDPTRLAISLGAAVVLVGVLSLLVRRKGKKRQLSQ